MDWTNVDKEFLDKIVLLFIISGLLCLYLYYRKKFKLFLWQAIFLLIDCFVFLLDIDYYLKYIFLIFSIVVPIVINRKEIESLEKSGKKAVEAFNIDNIDKIVFVIIIVIYFLLRSVFRV